LSGCRGIADLLVRSSPLGLGLVRSSVPNLKSEVSMKLLLILHEFVLAFTLGFIFYSWIIPAKPLVKSSPARSGLVKSSSGYSWADFDRYCDQNDIPRFKYVKKEE